MVFSANYLFVQLARIPLVRVERVVLVSRPWEGMAGEVDLS